MTLFLVTFFRDVFPVALFRTFVTAVIHYIRIFHVFNVYTGGRLCFIALLLCNRVPVQTVLSIRFSLYAFLES